MGPGDPRSRLSPPTGILPAADAGEDRRDAWSKAGDFPSPLGRRRNGRSVKEAGSNTPSRICEFDHNGPWPQTSQDGATGLHLGWSFLYVWLETQALATYAITRHYNVKHRPDGAAILLVQAVTLSRVVLTLLFVTTALTPRYRIHAIVFFACAAGSDLIDGSLARRLNAVTRGGGALDLFGDKFLTICSVLFAAAEGIDLLPCSLIVLREIFLSCIRGVHVDGQPVIPPTRVLGTITATTIRLSTLALLLNRLAPYQSESINTLFYLVAAFYALSLTYRIVSNRERLLSAFCPERRQGTR